MSIKRDTILVRKLLCFLEIAKKGNVTQVATEQGMKQSNLSKLIAELEDEFQTKLFDRKRGMKLTDAGQDLFRRTCEIEKAVNYVQEYSAALHKIEGDICLWVGEGIASSYISQCLPNFYERYPNVHLDIKCSLELPQQMDGIDVAIVFKEPILNPSISCILAKHYLEFKFYASKTYLVTHGHPKDMEELQKRHRLCVRNDFAMLWPEWRELLPKVEHVVTTTDQSSVLLSLVRDGVGIGFIPSKVGEQEEDLLQLDLPFKINQPFWVVSKIDSVQIPKVNALITYIKKIIAQ